MITRKIKQLKFPLAPQACAIVVNGVRSELTTESLINGWQGYQRIVVTDGAWHDFSQTAIAQDLLSRDTHPIVVLGDGDSIDQAPDCFIHTPNQDFTDFDKSIQYLLASGFRSADVFWASGGDMDHFLGNLSVASHYAQQMDLHFFGAMQSYFLQTQQTASELQLSGVNQRTVSLYPFPAATMTSEGLRYPLNDFVMQQHTQQSLRNQAVANTVRLRLTSGSAWLFISH